MTKNIDGLGQISARFDLFLLDQFGVLHDGNALYPGTIEALKHLKDQGKSVAIISNSGKRSVPNIERMVRIGIPWDLYDVLVTSGEVAWALLKQEHGAAANDPARRCLLITSGADTSPVDGLGAEVTEDSGQADFVLLAGGEGDRYDEAHYRRLLAPAAANGAPCICTNPDKISLGVNGQYFGPGRIAEIYEELGGQVRWIGKPFPAIYEHAIAQFPAATRDRTVCVGDSIEHDIAGGRAAGLQTTLNTDGILKGKSVSELEELIVQHDARPDFILAGFKA